MSKNLLSSGFDGGRRRKVKTIGSCGGAEGEEKKREAETSFTSDRPKASLYNHTFPFIGITHIPTYRGIN